MSIDGSGDEAVHAHLPGTLQAGFQVPGPAGHQHRSAAGKAGAERRGVHAVDDHVAAAAQAHAPSSGTTTETRIAARVEKLPVISMTRVPDRTVVRTWPSRLSFGVHDDRPARTDVKAEVAAACHFDGGERRQAPGLAGGDPASANRARPGEKVVVPRAGAGAGPTTRRRPPQRWRPPATEPRQYAVSDSGRPGSARAAWSSSITSCSRALTVTRRRPPRQCRTARTSRTSQCSAGRRPRRPGQQPAKGGHRRAADPWDARLPRVGSAVRRC